MAPKTRKKGLGGNPCGGRHICFGVFPVLLSLWGLNERMLFCRKAILSEKISREERMPAGRRDMLENGYNYYWNVHQLKLID